MWSTIAQCSLVRGTKRILIINLGLVSISASQSKQIHTYHGYPDVSSVSMFVQRRKQHLYKALLHFRGCL